MKLAHRRGLLEGEQILEDEAEEDDSFSFIYVFWNFLYMFLFPLQTQSFTSYVWFVTKR
uniref:Uncharacterized protein n=1 Tax=Nelumbo nucifera TaxID=4432 RepID=A0A822ZHS2_NELNU|nr:TPA_asm: hypothetical protein HUJ06_002300 [Nelumbo nucifera]